MRIVVDPDAHRVAFTSGANEVRVHSAQDGAHVATLRSGSSWLQCIALSTDASQVAEGMADGIIAVWDLARPDLPARGVGHAAAVTTLFFRPDGRLVSLGLDRRARVWDPSALVAHFDVAAHAAATRLVGDLSRTGLAADEIGRRVLENEALGPVVRQQALGAAIDLWLQERVP